MVQQFLSHARRSSLGLLLGMTCSFAILESRDLAAQQENPGEEAAAKEDGAAPEASQETTDKAAEFLAEESSPFKDKYDMLSEHDPSYGSTSSFLQWHGYVAFEYDDAQSAHSNFDLHEFYLSAKANVSAKLSFLAEMEFEHAAEKLILPIQAFGSYRVTDNHVFRAGLFYVPIQLPRSYTLRGNTNLLVRQVAVTHDIMFENWSVVGIGGYGNLFHFGKDHTISYDVALANGVAGMAPGDSWFDAIFTLQDHTEDNNSNKLVAGRINWAANDFADGKINLGVSYARQRYSPDSDPERMLYHQGFDFRYAGNSGFRVQAEWLKRSGDDNPPDLANGIGADATGWYFQFAKRFSRQRTFFNYVDFVAQVDENDLNEDTETSGDRRTLALGFNYSPEPYLIFKLEYDVVREIHGANLENNVFWFSTVFEF